MRLYLKETDLAGSMVSRLKMAPTLLLKHLALKDIHLSEIDRRDVQLWAEACSKEKAAGTVRTYISALAGLWEWAYRNKRVEGENPFKDLNLRLPTATAKRGAFTPAHVSALLAHASPGMRVLMEFALITGCRLGELTTITPQDFKQDGAVSYFQINEGKTENATRIVPLPLPMWERLREVVASGLWVREKTRTRDASAYWSAMFQKLKGSVLNDAEGLVFHSFRKMAATGYQRAGVFEGITAELLGHSRKGLTMSYGLYATGYSLEQLLAAVETMLASDYMQQYLGLFGTKKYPCL
ncbi:tyrosine-type recombinase/integrase [Aeromonas caviae]|uniref:tyrosine-type recombinase/integrase n=1 Tax=Aeromonas caviae TaxID=648 RepID=UPI0038D2272A